MAIRFLLIAILFTLFSCKENKVSRQIFNSTNLSSSFIEINADSSYLLKAPKGTILKIKKGTFKVANNAKIKLELKELFSARDIIAAGMQTKSNGKILSSGGMIYFNATADGKNLEMVKSIDVSTPSNSYDPDMKLFKGDTNSIGEVNWIEPINIDTPKLKKSVLIGEKIFAASCANCHKKNREYTGPQLFDVVKRVPSREWIYQFIKSPAAMIASKEPYAQKLYEKWNPVAMPGFPQFKKVEIDHILNYVQYRDVFGLEDLKPSIFKADSSKRQTEPCKDDTIYLPRNNNNEIDIAYSSHAEDFFDNKDSNGIVIGQPGNTWQDETGVYGFSINAPGWYNIDKFQESTTAIELSVTIENKVDTKMDVYLFVPERKVFLQAEYLGNNKYIFDYGDGKINLVLNEKTILFAVGSMRETMYYSSTSILLKEKQHIVMQSKIVTEDELNQFFDLNKIGDVILDIHTNEKEIIPCPDRWSQKILSTDSLNK